MTTRTATCSCGQLSATCEGDPVRVSVCHCLACQKRTGSAFGVQARWPRNQVTLAGDATAYVRIGDEGNRVTFHFCPRCGTTVYYQFDAIPETIAITVGSFADPGFPEPKFIVYEARKHAWLDIRADAEHHD